MLEKTPQNAHMSVTLNEVDVYVLSCFSRVWLFVTPWTIAWQAPLSMGFSKQEYWDGCPSKRGLPNPGIKPMPGIGGYILYQQCQLGNTMEWTYPFIISGKKIQTHTHMTHLPTSRTRLGMRIINKCIHIYIHTYKYVLTNIPVNEHTNAWES